MEKPLKSALALFLLLFFQCLHAQTVEERVGKKIGQYLLNESFSVQPLSVGGIDYYLVCVDGTDTFLLKALPNTDLFIVDSDREIAFVLRAHYRKYYEKSVAELRDYILLFNRSREPKESACKRDLGIDLYPCYDRDSCLKACYTPVCQGARTELAFLDAMRDFYRDAREIDTAVDEMNNGLYAYAGSDYEQGKLPAFGLFGRIETAISNLDKNKIFLSVIDMGYMFCNPIPFNTTALETAKNKLIEIANHQPTVGSADSKASEIVLNTRRRIEAYEKRIQEYNLRLALLKSNVSADFESVREVVEFSEQRMHSPELTALLENLNESKGSIIANDNLTHAELLASDFAKEASRVNSTALYLLSVYDTLIIRSNSLTSRLIDAKTKFQYTYSIREIKKLEERKRAVDQILSSPVNVWEIQKIRNELNEIEESLNKIEAIGEKPTIISWLAIEFGVDAEGFFETLKLAAFIFFILLFASIGAAYLYYRTTKESITQLIVKLPSHFSRLTSQPKTIGEAFGEKGNVAANEAVQKEPLENAMLKTPKYSGDDASDKTKKIEEEKTAPSKTSFGFPKISLLGMLRGKERKDEIPELKVRTLFKKGNAYYAVIGSVIRDQSGMLVPDGTTVSFSIDHGKITKSAKTVKGKVYAKMGFAKKPESAIVTITCGRITRKFRLVFY
ncbi:MAG: hypothetical protein QXP42_04550 [Candidatus Micrarchaeia archaeon]